MDSKRRDFLRLLSSAAALPAVGAAANAPLTSPTLSDAPNSVRDDFPELQQQINGAPLVYLDSAATTLRPRAVIDATSNFYAHDNANPAAALHTLARRSAGLYDSARQAVAHFVNARSPEEIIFTRGTTEAVNLAAASWSATNLRSGDELLLTIAEHYSNLLPWRLAAERVGAHLRFLDVDESGALRLDQLDALLSRRTKLVAFSHVSNVLGRINPAAEICQRARRAGAAVFIDAAQSVPHIPVDVQALGCDFLAFSGHKMLGPMGIGVLWARRELLDLLPPFQSGSNMAHELPSLEAPLPFARGAYKFEAGTPNAAGAVGLATAIQYLESLGRAEIWKREQSLTAHALEGLRSVPGLRLVGSANPAERISVFSFTIENRAPLDLVHALDQRGIAIRAGDLAALPLLKRFGVSAAARASSYLYTQPSDIEALADALTRL
jgi:cysteine desulfurase/selenocysteine lyase